MTDVVAQCVSVTVVGDQIAVEVSEAVAATVSAAASISPALNVYMATNFI